jgi:hypothetical protein
MVKPPRVLLKVNALKSFVNYLLAFPDPVEHIKIDDEVDENHHPPQ